MWFILLLMLQDVYKLRLHDASFKISNCMFKDQTGVENHS